MADIDIAKRLFFEGLEYLDRDNYETAEHRFIETLKFTPRSVPTLNNLAIAQFKQNKFSHAALTSTRVTEIDPNNVEAYSMLASCQLEQRAYAEALATSDKIISIDSKIAEAHSNRGYIFKQLGDFDEALSCFDYAISIEPRLFDAHLNRGNVLRILMRYEEALAANDRAIDIRPENAEAQFSRGNILLDLKRYSEALTAYDKAFAIKGEFGSLGGIRLHTKMQLCDWLNFDADSKYIVSSIKKGIAAASPLSFVSISSSPVDQLQCAKLWTAENYPLLSTWNGRPPKKDRVRIAYVSGDFRPHAISHLIVGLIEQHNEKHFEVTGISLQPEHPSDTGQRIKRAFENFIDVSKMTDEDVAKLIRQLEIDIAVDVNGYTGDCRTNIFARRPAPIQVNYLGYPGTMGASFIDYIIADNTLIPAHNQRHYAEKIVYLPNTYQANDENRLISDKVFSRAELGLPDKGFVFCCFNNNYKILPNVFDCWMRILNSVDASVLWLLESNSIASENLRKEASARGVNPERLIFAKRMQPAKHLARHRLADLFLDTLPYNAHTTASDALFAGLPVLTQIGETFAGRVAASLLNAVSLPELITSTQDEYEKLAVALARSPEKLAVIKRKLSENRPVAPLFDTKRFARHIETAYTAMYERHQANLPPDDIYVPQ